MAEEVEVKMVKYRKPDGSEIEINDHPLTVARATELGWEEVKKRTVRKKRSKED